MPRRGHHPTNTMQFDLPLRERRRTVKSHRQGKPLRVAGLFAGIGGIELGLHNAGHSTTLLCEIEPAAQAVLKARFPGVPLHDDVTTLRRLKGTVDLVAAGFPCQDLSQAGRTHGIRGRQSGLVAHVFELLKEHAVPWVILENVPFMLRLEGGRAMEYLVTELERLKYRWAYRVIDSRAFGLPQRRERVYLVASLTDDPRHVLFSGNLEAPGDSRRLNGAACGFYWTEGNTGLGWAQDAIPTLKGGSTVGIPSPPAILMPSGDLVTPDIRDAERLQGFHAGWTKPAEQVARPGFRWKLVGNAVTVDVAQWIGSRLLDLAGDAEATGEPLIRGHPWPHSAWYDGSRRYAAHYSTWPIRRRPRPLADFLKYPSAPLSVKATSGFYRRATASTLRFPVGFLQAVEAHLRRMQQPAV